MAQVKDDKDATQEDLIPDTRLAHQQCLADPDLNVRQLTEKLQWALVLDLAGHKAKAPRAREVRWL